MRDQAHRLIDPAAAAVPAAAAGWSAWQLAPLFGQSGPAWAVALGLGLFALAFAVMRRTDPAPAFTLPAMGAQASPSATELLLDHLWQTPEAAAAPPPPPPAPHAEDALLLDDPLPAAAADARVVRLFDPARITDPGELNQRIARHLARGGPAAPGAADASDELRQALAELRQALRPAAR